MPTQGSEFLNRIRKVQISKYESDLLKINDCFIDCCDCVKSDYVSFVMKYSIFLQCFLVICNDKSLKTKL